MITLDDSQLVRRCQKGDPAAYEQLFTLYSRRVIRTAYLITGSRCAAEEVLQESFIQIFRSIAQLKEPKAFSSWLYRVAVRAASRYLQRERMLHQTEARAALEGATAAPAPDQAIMLQQAVWEAVEKLPDNHRVAVVLYYFEDRPVTEIAEIMAVPTGTVKGWLHRARAALLEELGPDAAFTGGGKSHG